MRGRRSLALLALSAPLALMSLVAAPSALASGSFTSPTPVEGAVLGGTSFTVSATINAGSDSATLTLTGVDAGGTRLCSVTTSSRGGPLSSKQTLSLGVPSSACNTSRNGSWTATLTGGASGSRHFATNAAPAIPSGFSAEGTGARDVGFQWDMGNEPDLTGYALYDGSGDAIDSDVSLSHCNGSICTYAITYPADNPGTHDYALAAKRGSGGCGGCGSEVLSGRASDSATLTTPPPPPPSPEPTPTDGTGGSTTSGGTTTGGSTTGGSTTGGSTTGGSTGGSTSGGSAGGSSTGGTSVQPAPKPTLPTLPKNLAAARRAFALSFNAFSPSLGIPKLPPLPATFAPTVGAAPLPVGTYQPTLPYKPQTTVERTSTIRQITGVGSEIDGAQLARSIAVALILMLAAAHLRRFLGVRHDG